jgi:hypothetical protein
MELCLYGVYRWIDGMHGNGNGKCNFASKNEMICIKLGIHLSPLGLKPLILLRWWLCVYQLISFSSASSASFARFRSSLDLMFASFQSASRPIPIHADARLLNLTRLLSLTRLQRLRLAQYPSPTR